MKEDFNVIEYLEKIQKDCIDRIISLSKSGMPDDAVKLKANTTLLNKLVPDRTKMDLDIKNQAPYEFLLKNLKKDE